MKFGQHIVVLLSVIILCLPKVNAQNNTSDYWNIQLQIDGLRLPLPPLGYVPKYLDLNGDGKPDAIKSVTRDGIPILWLDDDGNMKDGDLEGDMVNDCLLIDPNKDGVYERVIKYADLDGDGKPDIQIWAEYDDGDEDYKETAHYMIVIDSDHDGIFNFINWNRFHIESWERAGISDFFCDYSGNSSFVKTHTSTDKMEDLRFNWENPFHFYDVDGDGLTEISMRLCDKMGAFGKEHAGGICTQMDFSIDIDNDNSHGANDFDYDLSLKFIGEEGFDYNTPENVFSLKYMRGLPEADTFFIDRRIRHLKELVFPDRDNIWDLTFKKGKWDKVYFAFDEDDDCGKWEREDFYYPSDDKNPFKLVGIDEWGADVAGDRCEWDLDNSGNGKLYISKFDGRIHLYGADWGVWRIDQNTKYYQRSHNKWLNISPDEVAVVKYTDTDNNGFMDFIEYDLDGDEEFEMVISLKELGIDDTCGIIDISNYTYKDYDKFHEIFVGCANKIWENALLADSIAQQAGINTSWYARYKCAVTIREKYDFGYWLQFYIYHDLLDKYMRENNDFMVRKVTKAYFGSDWHSLL